MPSAVYQVVSIKVHLCVAVYLTHMVLNASGDGAVKVIVPTNSENIAKLTPLARRFVGKISAVQTKAGASTHL